MVEQTRTNQELLNELSFLKKKNKQFENSEAQQKLTAMALHKSELNYRKLAEDMPALICTFLPDSTLTYVNKAYCELFQKHPEDLVGQKFLDFLPEDTARENVRRQYISLTPENPVKSYEHKVILSDGTNQYHWHRWTDRAFFSDDGQISYFQSIGQDITNHKRAMEALKESEIRFRQLADATWEGILIHRDGIILDGNQALFDMFGYETTEAIGRSFIDFIPPEFKEKALETLKRGDKSSLLRFEGKGRKKNGMVFPFEALGRPITHNNIPARVIAVRDLTERMGAEQKLQETLESLRKAIRATIQVLVTAVETRDPYTAGHQDRSAALANAIAREMGLTQDKINGIQMAGSIHDIGKLSIPAEILSKPTNLTEIEFPLIKEHAKKGFEMLKDVESPWPLAEIIYQHHERMDGSGYPRHLKGEAILMEARILAVADVVESMASHRPYRPAMGLDAALAEIENNKGKLYDANVVDACLRLFREKGFQLERV